MNCIVPAVPYRLQLYCERLSFLYYHNYALHRTIDTPVFLYRPMYSNTLVGEGRATERCAAVADARCRRRSAQVENFSVERVLDCSMLPGDDLPTDPGSWAMLIYPPPALSGRYRHACEAQAAHDARHAPAHDARHLVSHTHTPTKHTPTRPPLRPKAPDKEAGKKLTLPY